MFEWFVALFISILLHFCKWFTYHSPNIPWLLMPYALHSTFQTNLCVAGLISLLWSMVWVQYSRSPYYLHNFKAVYWNIRKYQESLKSEGIVCDYDPCHAFMITIIFTTGKVGPGVNGWDFIKDIINRSFCVKLLQCWNYFPPEAFSYLYLTTLGLVPMFDFIHRVCNNNNKCNSIDIAYSLLLLNIHPFEFRVYCALALERDAVQFMLFLKSTFESHVSYQIQTIFK